MGLSRVLRLSGLALLLVVVAGTANAGYWKAVYDLAPGSSNTTVNPGGTFVDDIGGSLEVHYDAASSGAPITGARLVAGNTSGSISQPAGVLTVTGTNAVALSPPGGGTPGAVGATIVTFAVITNSSTTGFIHCTEATPTASSLCPTFFSGVPASDNIPQSSTGPFTFNPFTFTTTAAVGDFTSPPIVMTPLPGVTTNTVYAGREISRVWVDVVGAPTMGLAGSGVLIAGLLMSGWKVTRRKA